jgi:hypothetical protein
MIRITSACVRWNREKPENTPDKIINSGLVYLNDIQIMTSRYTYTHAAIKGANTGRRIEVETDSDSDNKKLMTYLVVS